MGPPPQFVQIDILDRHLEFPVSILPTASLGLSHALPIGRSVTTALADWVDATAVALEPIYKAIRTDLIGGNYLQVDETPVRVMDSEVSGKTASGWLWVYARPKGGVLFDFQSSRGRAGPDKILKTFNGTIQSDGYALYGSMERDRPGLKRLACWAHARRKLHDALSDDPIRAKTMIALIARLYGIEKAARDGKLTAEARHELRGQGAPAILQAIHERLIALEPGRISSLILPKSPLGKAISYTLGQWTALQRYLEEGVYEIDNNRVENAIRPTCIGKKK